MSRPATHARRDGDEEPIAYGIEMPERRRERRRERARAARDEDLVPGWLGLLVLVLLIGVAALGGLLLNRALEGEGPQTPADYAIEDWQAIADSEPRNIEALAGLGYAFQQEGRFEDALNAYDRALALDATHAASMYNRGVVLLSLGRFDEGETALWAVLQLYPDHALAAKALGQYYIDMRQFESALQAVTTVVVEYPQYADLQYIAGYACEQLSRPAEAIAYYQAALAYAPDLDAAREGLRRVGGQEPDR